MVLADAQTSTSMNITVRNATASINRIYTYNQSSMGTTEFTYLENLSIRANISDKNGVGDIGTANISILTWNNTVLVRNASMTNISKITNGFTYEYNYTINRSSYPGNYTLTITVGNSTNSSQIMVKLTVKAIVGAPGSCISQELQIWNVSGIASDTLLEENNTNSECLATFAYPFGEYNVLHHPLAGSSSVWERKYTDECYAEVLISGQSGGGGTSGGAAAGGGGRRVSTTSDAFDQFVFDLFTVDKSWTYPYLSFGLVLQNMVHKSGDITLRYVLVRNDEMIHFEEEQIFVRVTAQEDKCSTDECPIRRKIYLEDCSEETYLVINAISLKDENNITAVLAETKVQICDLDGAPLLMALPPEPEEKEEPEPIASEVVIIILSLVVGVPTLITLNQWIHLY